MLPAEAVRTPRLSCSAEIWLIALVAPRILNDPMGCRFSSLRYISAGASSRLSLTSGVLIAEPRMIRCASRIESNVGRSGIVDFSYDYRPAERKRPMVSFRNLASAGLLAAPAVWPQSDGIGTRETPGMKPAS